METTSFEREVNTDPLGFTSQTALILRGLKASSIIPEAKKRNISTETLYSLTCNDFVNLGADVELAESLVKELSTCKRSNTVDSTNEMNDFSNILKISRQQLALLKSYLTCCRFKLSKGSSNFFIDENKCLSSSTALETAVNSLSYELLMTIFTVNNLKQILEN